MKRSNKERYAAPYLKNVQGGVAWHDWDRPVHGQDDDEDEEQTKHATIEDLLKKWGKR